MPRQRSANVSAQQCAQPGDTSSQPVTGFQVASVHSIALLSAKMLRRFDGGRLDWNGFACGVGFVEAEVGA